MTIGLPVSRIISVSATLTPSGAQYANIDSLLIIGDSAVIDTTTRIQSYNTLGAIASAFGTSAPEYLAASLFFGQTPQPTQLYIGRWARTATSGALFGAPLTTAQQSLSNFTAVTAGSFKVAVNGGGVTNVPAINLSSATSLSQVASIISTALAGASLAVTCTWTGSQFIFTSTTTGTSSVVSFLTAGTANDISGLLLGTVASIGAYVVTGIAPESALAAVQACDNLSTYWYAATFAASTMASDSDYTAIAGYIQGTNHLFGLTTGEATAIQGNSSADIGSVLGADSFTRTFCIYSTQNPYAAAAIFGNLLTTSFAGTNTMPTMMYKVLAGVTPEPLSQNSASVLDSKRFNYFANYQNGASINVNGTCLGMAYIDEIFGLDWLNNYVQTNIFNLLVNLPKVPQTDAGMNMLVNVIDQSMVQAVSNGLVAPGLWSAGGFGQLATGQQLSKGFYIYCPPLSTQSQTSRTARTTPLIQVAIKLAGAVHTVNALLTVQR